MADYDMYGDVYVPGEGLVETYMHVDDDEDEDEDDGFDNVNDALMSMYGMEEDVANALLAHYGVAFNEDCCLNGLDGADELIDLKSLDEKNLPKLPSGQKWKIASCLQAAIEKEKKEEAAISAEKTVVDWEESGFLGSVNETTFCEIGKLKQDGNKLFAERLYSEAVQRYDSALDKFPDTAFVLPATQLDEKVKILSNKAECLLRLKQYEEAGIAAYDAILLDDSHVKSRLRRAKACYRLVFKRKDRIIPATSSAVEDDLYYIIDGDGPGKEEAQSLLDEIHGKLSGEPMREVRRRMGALFGNAPP